MMFGTLIRALIFFLLGLFFVFFDALIDFLYFIFFAFEVRIIGQTFSSALDPTFAVIRLMIPSVTRIELLVIELRL